MEYRRLGKTELEVSHISFGALQLGGVPQDEVDQLVSCALENGINYIDTARVYGDSEVKLGIALEGRRDEVIISSKVISRDLHSFKEDVKTILSNLKTDFLDILFAHDVSTMKEWQEIRDNGVLDFMKEKKKEGVINHLAISTHSIEVGEVMLQEGPFELVMLAYNAANTQVSENLIPLAKEKDMGIVIMKPFAGGILTEANSRNLGFDIKAEESLRFAASHPDITTVIPGLDKMEYLKTALKVAEMPVLTSSQQQKIKEKVEIKSEHYCRGCAYCLPCPVELDIPSLLKLYNRIEAYNGVNWAQMHMIREEYEKLEKQADICVACDNCTDKCPYNLPVAELLSRMKGTMS
ncbi:aldo/keto reductase [Natronospora cellulosivora (SeqCode)]